VQRFGTAQVWSANTAERPSRRETPGQRLCASFGMAHAEDSRDVCVCGFGALGCCQGSGLGQSPLLQAGYVNRDVES
jgi:hypothetical protein